MRPARFPSSHILVLYPLWEAAARIAAYARALRVLGVCLCAVERKRCLHLRDRQRGESPPLEQGFSSRKLNVVKSQVRC